MHLRSLHSSQCIELCNAPLSKRGALITCRREYRHTRRNRARDSNSTIEYSADTSAPSAKTPPEGRLQLNEHVRKPHKPIPISHKRMSQFYIENFEIDARAPGSALIAADLPNLAFAFRSYTPTRISQTRLRQATGVAAHVRIQTRGSNRQLNNSLVAADVQLPPLLPVDPLCFT